MHFRNQIYWQYIGAYITEIHKGGLRGSWGGYLEGKIHRGMICMMGILLEIIDGKGSLGGKGCYVIGRKQWIPIDGHPPRKDL